MAVAIAAAAVAGIAADAVRLGAQRDWLWELLAAPLGTFEPWPREAGKCGPPHHTFILSCIGFILSITLCCYLHFIKTAFELRSVMWVQMWCTACPPARWGAC